MRKGLRYRFGEFELDSAAGELRRAGIRVRLHVQPAELLRVLLERAGEVVTREEISRELWPDGTFVDYEHGVNSAVNRLREALGDRASQPRFVETLSRRGYRFVAAVEVVGAAAEAETVGPVAVAEERGAGLLDRVLARPEDLPKSSRGVVVTLFLLLQGMYLAFYVGALANLGEIRELMGALGMAAGFFTGVVATAAAMIPVRVFLLCAVLFEAPGMRGKFLRMWPLLAVMDWMWALSPFLLLHHMSFGLALACVTPLVYAPLAQRSLVLMGAVEARGSDRAEASIS